ncbi:MAG: NAD(P)/FAD-dependent oxidoreductase [Gemmatimonadota bacterium]|nr:NAD(P)/FAD-dependent oxidoreductase [Gemmatimonadota bacterium]
MKNDAVVVGSGPNGLAAAVTLASHGLGVLVLEAADVPGGGARTEPLTLPGYLHDTCSAIHPMGAASPLFRALPLGRYGLEWLHPPLCLAHPFDDRPAARLHRSVDVVADDLGPDGDAWRGLIGGLAAGWDDVVSGVLGPPLAANPLGLLPWARSLLSADVVAREAFSGSQARGLFAGLAAHSILPLDRAPSAGVGLALAAAGHAGGWPLPRGGAGAITTALVSLLEDLGGRVVTGHRVRSMLDVPPARATVFDLTPGPLARVLGDDAGPSYARALARAPRGPGVFKLDWALSEPIPWRSSACREAGTVHVGGTYEEIAAGERAVWEEREPGSPFVLVSEPTRFDPTRAPGGGHVGWAYCHVPNGSPSDWTARIEAQVERFAPGFRDCIAARSALGPADLEARNANLAGGDIGGGAITIPRLLAGSVPRLDPYATPLPHVFVCSSAVPPGGGVHGMCGFHAARSVLARRFGRRVHRDPARALGPRLGTCDEVA